MTEIDDYYSSFLTLDVLTGLLVLLVVTDLTTLAFSFFTKFMGWHDCLTKAILSLNYVLLGLVAFLGFWSLNWDFPHWQQYMRMDTCFSYSLMDAWLRDKVAVELAGEKYVAVVRWVALALFIGITGLYLYGMTRKRRAENRERMYKNNRRPTNRPEGNDDGDENREAEMQERSADPNSSDFMALKPEDSRIN